MSTTTPSVPNTTTATPTTTPSVTTTSTSMTPNTTMETTTTTPSTTSTSTTTVTSSTSTTSSTTVSPTVTPQFFPNDSRCGKYWYRYNDICYLPTSITYGAWSEAKSTCTSWSSHLAQITSANEFYILKYLLDSDRTYWIGLEKTGTTTNYTWDVDNTAPTFVLEWETGRPQGYGCVYINNNKKWVDENCGQNTNRNFICKKPASN
ncbi:uncharacterized protein LOC135196354 [Macrobrachium nipponense]|uniref:uncharacterized protein LOC135196354 n=1 Tax=Macrobrachium nipponense TaxID=159736 RepID=UPI0030C84D52